MVRCVTLVHRDGSIVSAGACRLLPPQTDELCVADYLMGLYWSVARSPHIEGVYYVRHHGIADIRASRVAATVSLRTGWD